MEIDIGSNKFLNTNSILEICGKKQISLEIGENDFQVLLTMEMYDSNGKHIAKLRRNSWVFCNNDNYEITTNPKSLKLIDKTTNETIVEINVVSSTKIQILNGRFYAYKGQPVIITPKEMVISGSYFSGCVFDSCGGVIAIK